VLVGLDILTSIILCAVSQWSPSDQFLPQDPELLMEVRRKMEEQLRLMQKDQVEVSWCRGCGFDSALHLKSWIRSLVICAVHVREANICKRTSQNLNASRIYQLLLYLPDRGFGETMATVHQSDTAFVSAIERTAQINTGADPGRQTQRRLPHWTAT